MADQKEEERIPKDSHCYKYQDQENTSFFRSYR